jgi:transcriptional regulator
MYLPSSFAEQDPEKLARFIQQNGFATLISQDESGLPFASHVPILYDAEPKPGVLIGHLARANPQWKHLKNSREVLVIFHGPHAYISPRWYESSPAVPTWNYAVVHAYGVPKIFSEEHRLQAVVQRMVRFYEGTGQNSWSGDLPADYMSKQLKAIVGFEVHLTRLEGKFKLGQNRPKVDVIGAYGALSQSAHAEDRSMAQFMKDQGLVG